MTSGKQIWLVLDCSYLCHRAFHTMGGLSFKGSPTGVIFGFLKQVGELQETFRTPRVVFTFDHPKLKRKEVYPAYKQKRHSKERSEEEKKQFAALHEQIQCLRTRYLPMIGFRNILCWHGLESDDVMASLAKYRPPSQHFILVTADKDLFQMLRPGVEVWNPHTKTLHTHETFQEENGIEPNQYAYVKAIAGCSSDEVEGISRVGEATATKFLRGDLKEDSSLFKKIRSREGRAIVRRNWPLVKLPYKGTPRAELHHDDFSEEGWKDVVSTLGFRSLEKRPPFWIQREIDHGKRK